MRIIGKPSGRKSPLRVLVADDSPGSREDLSATISREEHIEVVGSADKAIEALSLIETLRPDVVLLNIQMSGRTLLSMLHLIKRATPVPIVVVLAPHPVDVLRERYLDSGADYVFSKPIDFKRVAGVLRKVAAAKKSSRRKES